MYRCYLLLSVVLFAMLSSGCTAVAPQYVGSSENVQKLKAGGDAVAKVGGFTVKEGMPGAAKISLRASPLVSPYTGTYADYLAIAIKQELALAGRLSKDADLEISGILQKNDMDASGLAVGNGEIEARFILKKGGATRYDKVMHARTEWESSFAGYIAIPNAQQQYPVLVQKLLAALYADPEFMLALK